MARIVNKSFEVIHGKKDKVKLDPNRPNTEAKDVSLIELLDIYCHKLSADAQKHGVQTSIASKASATTPPTTIQAAASSSSTFQKPATESSTKLRISDVTNPSSGKKEAKEKQQQHSDPQKTQHSTKR